MNVGDLIKLKDLNETFGVGIIIKFGYSDNTNVRIKWLKIGKDYERVINYMIFIPISWVEKI